MFAVFQIQRSESGGKVTARHPIGLYADGVKAASAVDRHRRGWKSVDLPKPDWEEIVDESGNLIRRVWKVTVNRTVVEFHIVLVTIPEGTM